MTGMELPHSLVFAAPESWQPHPAEILPELFADLADHDRHTHEHRWDLSAEMVGSDPAFHEHGATFYDELRRSYGKPAAHRLWEAAGEVCGEEWRRLPGFGDHYDVSDSGRVRSRPRAVACGNGRTRHLKQRVLIPHLDTHGYTVARLTCDGFAGARLVSGLVAAAFIGPRPKGFQVAHYDRNPQHNCPLNLRYASRRENEADKLRHGTRLRGETAPNSRLTAEQVLDIYSRAVAGEPHAAIAADHDVGTPYVSMILHGRIWASVTGASAATAQQARATRAVTHCKHGHLFDEQNTYIKPNGFRACRACFRRRSADQRAKREAA